MGGARTSWRAVTGHWDIVTTGASRGSGLTPVAREIDDLVLRTGQLAYQTRTGHPPTRSQATDALKRSIVDKNHQLRAVWQKPGGRPR